MADSKRIAELKEKVALLPESPGIYQFLGADGRVIYVGKAKTSNAASIPILRRKPTRRQSARDGLADRRPEAHGRGNRERGFPARKQHDQSLQPRYNILLKDDKTYPWIVIRNEPFPRVQSTRRRERDGSRYFGPYASVYIQKNGARPWCSIHSLRTCSLNLSPEAIAKGKYSVCLEYHIGNCKGPCVGLQSETEYREGIELVTSLLRGDTREDDRIPARENGRRGSRNAVRRGRRL